MSADTRLRLGIALLVLGLIMPAGTFFVANTAWPAGVKALAGGVLLFGLEIMAIPAVALMGKENFDRIAGKVKGLFKRLKPTGNVGKTRYTIGLAIFLGPTLYAWVASYIPSWLPTDYGTRVWVNLGLDVIFLISLFVLGGDFWDKLRALFFCDARAVFPAPAQAGQQKD